jgi:hypothetical protein
VAVATSVAAIRPTAFPSGALGHFDALVSKVSRLFIWFTNTLPNLHFCKQSISDKNIDTTRYSESGVEKSKKHGKMELCFPDYLDHNTPRVFSFSGQGGQARQLGLETPILLPFILTF